MILGQPLGDRGKKKALQVCYDLMRRKSCLVIGDVGLHAHMYMSIGSVIYLHRVH